MTAPRQRPEHLSASLRVHRVVTMPEHYNRDPAGKLGQSPFGPRAVVLSAIPTSCPKCWNPCLQDRGLEVSCMSCGWEQIVDVASSAVKAGGR